MKAKAKKVPVEAVPPRQRGLRRGGPGRKPGVPNKVTQTVKQMMLGALEKAGGEAYLLKFAKSSIKEERIAFFNGISRIMPTELTGVDGGPIRVFLKQITEEMTRKPPPKVEAQHDTGIKVRIRSEDCD